MSLYKETVLILWILNMMWKCGFKLLSTTPKLRKVSSAQHAFEQFSSWKRLLRAITKRIQVTRTFSKTHKVDAVDARWQAKTVVICCVQQQSHGEELNCLRDRIQLSKKSPLRTLNPFIDEDGLLRIGGRLINADLPRDKGHPVILPKTHHITTLIVRHYHEDIYH